GKRKVVKHNALIEATYKLTLNEQRILLCLLSKLNSKTKRLPPAGITITPYEVREAFNLDESDNYVYEVMKSGANGLWNKEITRIYDRKGVEVRDRLRWLSRDIQPSRNEVSGAMTFYFNDHLATYIIDLAGRFTQYELAQVGNLSSAHSIRIYELLIQYKNSRHGVPPILLDDFKARLGIEGKYSKWGDLKKRVIDPAKKELEQYSDIEFTYSAQRGRANKVLGIQFDVNYEKGQLPLPGPQKIPPGFE
ncbi:MAG: replication initiation protein, partial [Candidatus Sedimenticola sp. 6PFRAG1]